MDARRDVRDVLEPLLIAMPGVLAALEGGSAATGHLDAWSDLDLEVICEDEAVETVMAAVRDALALRFGIEREYRLPEPAWHGFSQAFWQIGRVTPLFYVDFAVIKHSLPDKFMQTDRHGHAVVWFDKDAVVGETTTPQEQLLARGRRLYKAATATDFLMILETRKGIARDDFAEAFASYYRFLANNLAILLNLKHRPVKADFGLRYARRDYPNEDSALVETALKVATVAELAASLERLVSRFETLRDELAASWS